MGDVVSMHTKKVVQSDPAERPPLPQRSVTEPGGLMLDDDQIGEFIALVDDLNYASDREAQRVTMNAIRQAVRAWPDG